MLLAQTLIETLYKILILQLKAIVQKPRTSNKRNPFYFIIKTRNLFKEFRNTHGIIVFGVMPSNKLKIMKNRLYFLINKLS